MSGAPSDNPKLPQPHIQRRLHLQSVLADSIEGRMSATPAEPVGDDTPLEDNVVQIRPAVTPESVGNARVYTEEDFTDEEVAPQPPAASLTAAPVSQTVPFYMEASANDEPPAVVVAKEDPRLAAMSAQIAELSARNAEMDARYKELMTEAAKPATVNRPVNYELTPEEQSAYSGSLPTIEKVAGRLVALEVARVREELAAFKQDHVAATTGVRSDLNRISQVNFEQSLRTAIPSFDTVIRHPSFAEYIARPMPYSGGVLLKTRLTEAFKNRDSTTLIEAVNDFKKFMANNNSVAPLGAFEQPRATNVATPASSPTQSATKKPILLLSKRKEASDAHRRGNLSTAQLEAINNLYTIAESEGRVDYNR